MIEHNKENEVLENLQNDALNIFGKYDLDKSLIWMTEEYGEMIQEIRKKSKEDITEEMGDLFAWILCISNILDIKLKYCDGIEKIMPLENCANN